MKKFTFLLILLALITYGLLPSTAVAQNNMGERNCNFISDDGCFAVGYVSVTESSSGPGNSKKNDFDVEIFFWDKCNVVTEIKINKNPGPPFIISGEEITEDLDTRAFQVSGSAFKDGRLKVTIEFAKNDRIMVDIIFDESFNCGAIEPLPVELTSFIGKPTESGISLEWETASELNNSHFEVQRSADGASFESIATVQGRGTTSTPASYTLTDKLPGNGTNYYRLKQVDYDDAFSYSKTIAVKWNAGDAMKALLLPNPCRGGNCNIAISNAANQETMIQLKDMAGRVVYSKTVKSNSYLLELPMHELKQLKGLYFMTAATGNQVVHQRIVLE